jgi:hypothetical protein
VPTANVDVEKLAVPVAIVPVPNKVVPSRKLTVPVAPAGTVVVKVMGLPKVAGFGNETSVTTVMALLTTCERAAEEPPL